MMNKFFGKTLSATNCIRIQMQRFINSKKPGFQYALFFALGFAMLFNPIKESNVAVREFTRTFGLGIMHNWDCSRVIQNFYVWILLFTVLLFVFWIFFASWKNKDRSEEENSAVRFLDGIMVLGCTYLVLRACSFFVNGTWRTLVSYSSVILFFVIASAFLFLIFHLQDAVTFDFYQRIVFSLFASSFCGAVIFKVTSVKALFFILLLCLTVTVAFVKIFRSCEKSCIISSFVKSCSVTLCFFPLMTSIYFELLNILNSHNIFVAHIRRYYAIASFLLFCCTALLSFFSYKKNSDLTFWKNIAYPVMILGLTASCVQTPLSSVYYADMFESANLSIPVSNFLNFGKIPVVTCYPGHMMTGVWQAFLYAILNGDKTGAVFSPYSWYLEFPVLTVLFFCFVRIILDKDTAFFMVLLFPFAYGPVWTYFGMGMLLALAAVFYVQKKTVNRAFLLWISFVWCALYRLDIGFAFFAATAASLAVWALRGRNSAFVRQLSATLAVTAFFCLIAWCILCLVSGVNPILRLLEFLKLSASNQNWAYNHIGNKDQNLFATGYMLVPFSVAALLSYCVFSKKLVNHITQSNWVLLLIFGFSFFFNMPRGLVRHSLAENQLSIVLWTAPVFISAALSVLLMKKKLFIPLLAFLTVLSIQFLDGRAFQFNPVADGILPQIRQNLDSDRSKKTERVIFNTETKNWCETYKLAMDSLLEDDETYLDFMNRTFAYSVIGRECPVYVTQSPLQLSGEFTQEMFIKEISDRIEKIPVALLPLNDSRAGASLDSILNSYRYYKVSEFIFTHYRPLCMFGDFAVWALDGRYDELKSRLTAADKNAMVPIDWNYSRDFHSYSLSYIPLLWAEKDKKNAMGNKVLVQLEPGDSVHRLDISGIEKAGGNYLQLKINNPGQTGTVAVRLGTSGIGDFSEFITFSFTAETGEHDYLVRVSTDYLWYFAGINAVRVDSGGLSVSELKLLEGD